MPGHGHPDEESTSAREPRSASEAWPTRPLISYDLTGCSKGKQARRMVASHHPFCDSLAAPCCRLRLCSREALELGFVSPPKSSPNSCMVAGMQDLPLFRGQSRWVEAPGSPLVTRIPPSRDLSVTRTRLVQRSSFAVIESPVPVTRDEDDVLRPSAPAGRFQGLFILL